MSRCRSCNKNLSDREATRKYANWEDIANPNDRYIELCNSCIGETDLLFVDNVFLADEGDEDELYDE